MNSENLSICYFPIRTKEEIGEYYDIAINTHPNLSFIEQLKQRSIIPYLINESDHMNSVKSWEKISGQTSLFSTEKRLYYSIAHNKESQPA